MTGGQPTPIGFGDPRMHQIVGQLAPRLLTRVAPYMCLLIHADQQLMVSLIL
jgi:hypothetical protein